MKTKHRFPIEHQVIKHGYHWPVCVVFYDWWQRLRDSLCWRDLPCVVQCPAGLMLHPYVYAWWAVRVEKYTSSLTTFGRSRPRSSKPPKTSLTTFGRIRSSNQWLFSPKNCLLELKMRILAARQEKRTIGAMLIFLNICAATSNDERRFSFGLTSVGYECALAGSIHLHRWQGLSDKPELIMCLSCFISHVIKAKWIEIYIIFRICCHEVDNLKAKLLHFPF